MEIIQEGISCLKIPLLFDIISPLFDRNIINNNLFACFLPELKIILLYNFMLIKCKVILNFVIRIIQIFFRTKSEFAIFLR